MTEDIIVETPIQSDLAPSKVIEIPELCLIGLVGASGSGKSTFARKHFKPTEVISSDHCRALVSDDELDQSATQDAFDVAYYIASKRLERGKLAVIDATNVQPDARKALVALAKSQNVLAVAVVLNVNERVCHERNHSRTDRQIPPNAISRQCMNLRKSMRDIKREGFRYSFILNEDQIEDVSFIRTKLWSDRKNDHGPFDIIGDIHGCYDQLVELLTRLGYTSDASNGFVHPGGRRAFFVGDFVDRGPYSVAVLDAIRKMVESGNALAVPGNHDEKLLRWLRGKKVSVTHGLQNTLDQISQIPDELVRDWKLTTCDFLDRLVSHYVLDGGKLVVAHAGISEKLQGRSSGRVREFCLYGDTTGEIDDDGLPVRKDWAADYRGDAAVIYGHTPQAEAHWINNTINIDTGCVFGGSLTALRWPERELVSVKALQTYAEPARPFLNVARDQQTHFDLLLSDVYPTETVSSGNRRITAGLIGSVLIERANSAAALELMSRFGVDPRWIVYLPPTMSPSETEKSGDYLEHPNGAFAYYRSQGIHDLICEEKHMGSRAVIVICRDQQTASRSFGIQKTDAIGECYTRTGRRFFDEPVRTEFLQRVQKALTESAFWDRHETGWAVIDAEIMPWNTKAQGLLREQYAPVGAAAKVALSYLEKSLSDTKARCVVIESDSISSRIDSIDRYIQAYRAYCWPVDGLNGVRVAPFHLLATEGKVHTDRDHLWHLHELGQICDADPVLLQRTGFCQVNLEDENSILEATNWWLEKTGRNAEGMVVKPLTFVARGARGITQPAIKCRGREYLRIIYGPEYTAPHNLEELKHRGLGRKRNLALREFALGIEGLERFVANAPLHKVHECAFAVLALESEPVDPRL